MGKEKKKKKKADSIKNASDKADKVDEKDERILKIMKRLEGEEKVQERVNVEAKLVSSPPNQPGVNIKIKLQILDTSFYAKAAKVFFNAGTDKFDDIDMEKVDMDNFAVILANVPKEIQIVYYVSIRDKSGSWQQFPRPELIETDGTSEEEPYFSFSVEADGTISYKKEWDDSGTIACKVCGKACLPSWDRCPECKTPLYDTTQAVFLDEQHAKTEARKKMKKELEDSWEDASDEEWRGLPECPNCGYTVQLEWAKCPICNFDLTTVELQKMESYEEFMTEEEKEAATKRNAIKEPKEHPKEKIKKKKKKPEEPIWKDEDGVDIL